MPRISFLAGSRFSLGEVGERQPAKSSSRPMTAAAALKHLNRSNSAACSGNFEQGQRLHAASITEGWRQRDTQRETLFLSRQRRLSEDERVGREAGTEPSTSVARRVGGGTVTLQYLAGSLRLQPWNQAHLSCRGSSLRLFIYIYIYIYI